MQDRTPTPGQEGRVLITPENGSAPFYAKVEMADNPTNPGTPLNKETLLQDSTAALYGLDETAVPDDVLAHLPMSINSGWVKFAEYTTHGTYTWTVPDLFGGKPYTIGVLIIGAGASGNATASDGSSSNYYNSPGGNSGYSRCITMEVTPGQTYNVVVGQGGAAVSTGSVTGNKQVIGLSGGSSSFNGISAEGGGLNDEGAQCSLDNRDAQWGGEITAVSAYGVTLYGSPIDCYNPFESSRMLGAGGYAQDNNVYGGGKNPQTNIGGGDSAFSLAYQTPSIKAEDATAPGCGGGGASIRVERSNPGTATSGAGADGAVMFYAQGTKEDAA